MKPDDLIRGRQYWLCLNGFVFAAIYQCVVARSEPPGPDEVIDPKDKKPDVYLFLSDGYRLKPFVVDSVEMSEVYQTQEEATKSLGDWYQMQADKWRKELTQIN